MIFAGVKRVAPGTAGGDRTIFKAELKGFDEFERPGTIHIQFDVPLDAHSEAGVMQCVFEADGKQRTVAFAGLAPAERQQLLALLEGNHANLA